MLPWPFMAFPLHPRTLGRSLKDVAGLDFPPLFSFKGYSQNEGLPSAGLIFSREHRTNPYLAQQLRISNCYQIISRTENLKTE